MICTIYSNLIFCNAFAIRIRAALLFNLCFFWWFTFWAKYCPEPVRLFVFSCCLDVNTMFSFPPFSREVKVNKGNQIFDPQFFHKKLCSTLNKNYWKIWIFSSVIYLEISRGFIIFNEDQNIITFTSFYGALICGNSILE